MDTNRFVASLKTTQAAREELKRRHARNVELRAFVSAGTMVMAGLLLAALYGLATHQISN
jgi:hypothetical protein